MIRTKLVADFAGKRLTRCTHLPSFPNDIILIGIEGWEFDIHRVNFNIDTQEMTILGKLSFQYMDGWSLEDYQEAGWEVE